MLKKLTDGESKVAPPNKLTAVHFNQYFSSIGSTTISHLLTTDDNNTENAIVWRGSNCTSRFDFNDIHLEAVMKQLFALGNTSNNDVLGFDSKLLFLGAITIWRYTCDINLHKIQRLQNRAARFVTGNYDYVTIRGAELVKRLKLMCVTQRRDYFMSILMYKSIHGMAPAYLCNEITLHSEIAERTTRYANDNNVFVPLCSS